MSILYTVDSRTVDEDEFKERISDTGYYDMPQGERTWTLQTDKELKNSGFFHDVKKSKLIRI